MNDVEEGIMNARKRLDGILRESLEVAMGRAIAEAMARKKLGPGDLSLRLQFLVSESMAKALRNGTRLASMRTCLLAAHALGKLSLRVIVEDRVVARITVTADLAGLLAACEQ